MAHGRKFVRVMKFLLAGVAVFCVSWIACVNEWRGGEGGPRWRVRPRRSELSTMRTIVAYSEGKQAELDRPSPVTCDSLPAFPTVPEINRTWTRDKEWESTWQRVEGTTVSLYAAYYDERLPQRYIRILAVFQGRYFSEQPLYCQTRQLSPYEESSVEVVAARPLEIWSPLWDTISKDVETPVLLSCPLTGPLYFPSVVSVVSAPCDDPTNAFSVEPSLDTQYSRNFTICVKDMNFDKDISQNLVEWIEINKILGVDMIDVYVENVNNNSENVLLHYRNKGFVRIFHVPIRNKQKRPLWQRRRDHLITYNDCLYRNLGQSVYVVPLDVDEIVLPKIAYTWNELIHRLRKYGWDPVHNSAIAVQNVFFFEFMQGVNSYKYRKKHINRNKRYIKRDNVRIRKTTNLETSEIELVDNTDSISNEVIYSEDREFYDSYKKRCGREFPVPKLLKHIVPVQVSPVGEHGKSLLVTRKVLTTFNHYPLDSLGVAPFGGWPAPLEEVQLNHYKESCNPTLTDCGRYNSARPDTTALRLRRKLTRALANAICTINNN